MAKNRLLLLFLCFLLNLPGCAPQPTAVPPEPPALTATYTPPPEPEETPTPTFADCLIGDWQISPATVENLLISLTSVPSLQIMEGNLYLKFDGSDFSYHSNELALRSSFMDSYLDARADILIEGTYTVEGDLLHFNQQNASNQLYDWVIVKGDYVRPFQGTSPVVPFEIAGEGSYTCDNDTLQLTLRDMGKEIVIDLVRTE